MLMKLVTCLQSTASPAFAKDFLIKPVASKISEDSNLQFCFRHYLFFYFGFWDHTQGLFLTLCSGSLWVMLEVQAKTFPPVPSSPGLGLLLTPSQRTIVIKLSPVRRAAVLAPLSHSPTHTFQSPCESPVCQKSHT